MTYKIPVAVQAELRFPGQLTRGSENAVAVRRVQEWLTLHGFGVVIDGDFGPATAAAIRAYQASQAVLWAASRPGEVDAPTWSALVAQFAAAFGEPTLRTGSSIGATVASFASNHEARHPREVGGQNRGPWVRAYMDGNEGTAWPWCAGFATSVIAQAEDATGISTGVKRTFSCDTLAAHAAQRSGLLLAKGSAAVSADVAAGDLFLVRGTQPGDWVHTGIVIAVLEGGAVVRTCEGNTNDEGSREGYEVCFRHRAARKLDFVLLGRKVSATA